MGFFGNLLRKNKSSIDGKVADGKQEPPSGCQASGTMKEDYGTNEKGEKIEKTISFCLGVPPDMTIHSLGVDPDRCIYHSEKTVSDILDKKADNYKTNLSIFGKYFLCNQK